MSELNTRQPPFTEQAALKYIISQQYRPEKINRMIEDYEKQKAQRGEKTQMLSNIKNYASKNFLTNEEFTKARKILELYNNTSRRPRTFNSPNVKKLRALIGASVTGPRPVDALTNVVIKTVSDALSKVRTPAQVKKVITGVPKETQAAALAARPNKIPPVVIKTIDPGILASAVVKAAQNGIKAPASMIAPAISTPTPPSTAAKVVSVLDPNLLARSVVEAVRQGLTPLKVATAPAISTPTPVVTAAKVASVLEPNLLARSVTEAVRQGLVPVHSKTSFKFPNWVKGMKGIKWPWNSITPYVRVICVNGTWKYVTPFSPLPKTMSLNNAKKTPCPPAPKGFVFMSLQGGTTTAIGIPAPIGHAFSRAVQNETTSRTNPTTRRTANSSLQTAITIQNTNTPAQVPVSQTKGTETGTQTNKGTGSQTNKGTVSQTNKGTGTGGASQSKGGAGGASQTNKGTGTGSQTNKGTGTGSQAKGGAGGAGGAATSTGGSVTFAPNIKIQLNSLPRLVQEARKDPTKIPNLTNLVKNLKEKLPSNSRTRNVIVNLFKNTTKIPKAEDVTKAIKKSFANMSISELLAHRKTGKNKANVNAALRVQVATQLRRIGRLSSNERASMYKNLYKTLPLNFTGRANVEKALISEVRKMSRYSDPTEIRRRLNNLRRNFGNNLPPRVKSEYNIQKLRAETNERSKKRWMAIPPEAPLRQTSRTSAQGPPLRQTTRTTSAQGPALRQTTGGPGFTLPPSQNTAILKAGGPEFALRTIAAVPGGAPKVALAAQALNETNGNVQKAQNKGIEPAAINAVKKLGGPTNASYVLEGLNTLSQKKPRTLKAAPSQRLRLNELNKVIDSVKKRRLISLVAHNVTKMGIHNNENRKKKYYKKVLKSSILRRPLANKVRQAARKKRVPSGTRARTRS